MEDDESLWLEALRVSPKDPRTILAQAVKAVPKSEELWLRAAELEPNYTTKCRMLKKGLDHIPDSARLWQAFAFVDPGNEIIATLRLLRAVERCPLHADLWLALARVDMCEQARDDLERAAGHLPTEPAIWIALAELEEANGNHSAVEITIQRAIRSLQSHGVVIDREAWLRRAEAAERASSILTCHVIIKCTIGNGLDGEDSLRRWMAECKKRGSVETARAIYAHALSIFLTQKNMAAELELERTKDG